MRIALAQVTSGPDPRENLRLIEAWTEDAAARGAELVIFPEAMMRSFGHPLAEIAEPLDGPWASAVADVARKLEVCVVAGMFVPGTGNRVRNALVIARRDGAVAAYDKVHLFDAFGYRESDSVIPGDGPVVLEVAGVKVGFATCYDVRFPGLFTCLAQLGAQLVVLCASWGAGPGKVEQWQLLTRARALDATVFVAGCGQAEPATSTPGGAPTGIGHSVVVSPLGAALGSLAARPGLLVVDLDLLSLDHARSVVPVLANARY